jgi:hypothetical protein
LHQTPPSLAKQHDGKTKAIVVRAQREKWLSESAEITHEIKGSKQHGESTFA